MGGGGLDVKNGNFVQEYWRDLASLHINKKELLAAINSVKSLSKKGETVSLTVDNQVVYYLAKGGEERPFQHHPSAFLQMAHAKRDYSSSSLGPLSSMFGRSHLQMVTRQGGLCIKSPPLQLHSKFFHPLHKFTNRSLCLPRQHKTPTICQSLATLASKSSKCSSMFTRGDGGFICQPPLVSNNGVSPKAKNVPQCPSFNGTPLLGFCHMVAPINKNESPKSALPEDHPLQGYVQKLLVGRNAPPNGT